MKALRALRQPYAAVVSWALALGALAGVGYLAVETINARHARRQLEAKLCAAELKAWRARDPFVARLVVEPADPCTALRVVAR